MTEKVLFYLEDLSVDIQHVDSDLHVLGDALPSLLKLPLLQRDVKVIPHLSCRERGKAEGADGLRLCMPVRIINDLSAARQRFVLQRLRGSGGGGGGGSFYISRIQSLPVK